MAPAYERITGSAGSDDWDYYHVVGEHTPITKLVLNNFIKMVDFL
jgi:hypothetical protein